MGKWMVRPDSPVRHLLDPRLLSAVPPSGANQRAPLLNKGPVRPRGQQGAVYATT